MKRVGAVQLEKAARPASSGVIVRAEGDVGRGTRQSHRVREDMRERKRNLAAQGAGAEPWAPVSRSCAAASDQSCLVDLEADPFFPRRVRKLSIVGNSKCKHLHVTVINAATLTPHAGTPRETAAT